MRANEDELAESPEERLLDLFLAEALGGPEPPDVVAEVAARLESAEPQFAEPDATPAERLFDLLLGEAIGGSGPPDLSERILASLANEAPSAKQSPPSDAPAVGVPLPPAPSRRAPERPPAPLAGVNGSAANGSSAHASAVEPPPISDQPVTWIDSALLSAPPADWEGRESSRGGGDRSERPPRARTSRGDRTLLWTALTALAASVLVALVVGGRLERQGSLIAEPAAPGTGGERDDASFATRQPAVDFEGERIVAGEDRAPEARQPPAELGGPRGSFELALEDLPFERRGAEFRDNAPSWAATWPRPTAQEDAQIVAAIDRALTAAWNNAGVTPAPPAEADEVAQRLRERLGAQLSAADRFGADEIHAALLRPEASRRLAGALIDRMLGPAAQGRLDEPQRAALVQTVSTAVTGERPFDAIAAEFLAARGSSDPEADDFNPHVLWAAALAGPQSVPLTEQFGHALLDLDVRCSRCHDHPLQAGVTQSDFWRLNALFGSDLRWSVPPGGKLRVQSSEYPAGVERPVAFYEMPDGRQRAAAPGLAPRWIALEAESGAADAAAVDTAGVARLLRGNPQLARATVNRLWEALYGAPLVGTASAPEAPPADESLEQLRELLADQLRAHDFDLGRAAAWMAAARPMRLASPEVLRPENRLSADDPAIAQAERTVQIFAAHGEAKPPVGLDQRIAMAARWNSPATLSEAGSSGTVLGQARTLEPRDPRRGNGSGRDRAAEVESRLRATFPSARLGGDALPAPWLESVGRSGGFDQQARHLFYVAGYWHPTPAQLELAQRLQQSTPSEAAALRQLWWALRH